MFWSHRLNFTYRFIRMSYSLLVFASQFCTCCSTGNLTPKGGTSTVDWTIGSGLACAFDEGGLAEEFMLPLFFVVFLTPWMCDGWTAVVGCTTGLDPGCTSKESIPAADAELILLACTRLTWTKSKCTYKRYMRWENFTRDQPWPRQLFRPSFRSHEQAFVNLTNEWTPVGSEPSISVVKLFHFLLKLRIHGHQSLSASPSFKHDTLSLTSRWASYCWGIS